MHRRSCALRRELTHALTCYIGRWHDQERRHSALGYVRPAEYERMLLQTAQLGVDVIEAIPVNGFKVTSL